MQSIVASSRLLCRGTPASIRTASAYMALRQLHASNVARSAASGSLHKESSHWKIERVVSVGCLGLVPAAMVVGPSMPIDMAIGVLFPLHGYWGLDQVITDYVHTSGMKGALDLFNKVFLAGTVGGLCYFNYKDVGITKAVQDLWHL